MRDLRTKIDNFWFRKSAKKSEESNYNIYRRTAVVIGVLTAHFLTITKNGRRRVAGELWLQVAGQVNIN
jgi:hypothetical protein